MNKSSVELLMSTPAWPVFQDQTHTAIANNDPSALLVAEHEFLRSIIMATDNALQSGGSLSTSGLMAKQEVVRAFIEAHMLKEELLFFPAVEAALSNVPSAIRSQEMCNEHDAIRIRYERLQRDIGTIRAARSFHHLWRALVIHFVNEERYLSEAASQVLTTEIRHDLIIKMLASSLPAVGTGD